MQLHCDFHKRDWSHVSFTSCTPGAVCVAHLLLTAINPILNRSFEKIFVISSLVYGAINVRKRSLKNELELWHIRLLALTADTKRLIRKYSQTHFLRVEYT